MDALGLELHARDGDDGRIVVRLGGELDLADAQRLLDTSSMRSAGARWSSSTC